MSRKRKSFELIGNFQEEIKWSLCLLCQVSESASDIRCPANNISKGKGSGYTSLAYDLIKFYELGELPRSLLIYEHCSGSVGDLEQLLNDNNAIFHKNCRRKYEHYKLDRLRNKKSKACECVELDDVNPVVESTSQQAAVSTESRVTRSSTTSCTSNIKTSCLFCNGEESEDSEDLTFAQTIPLRDKIWNGATILQDGKILSKLVGGDMVALEAKYHRTCLIHFYNRVRKHANNGNKNTDLIDISYGLAVEEVIEHITDSRELSKVKAPVFQLLTLANLVVERMIDQGVSQEDAENKVHKTRLKSTILERLPALKAYQEGRCIFLTFEGDVGHAILIACDESVQDRGRIMKKTAEFLRNDMFEVNPQFSGQFDVNCEQNSVSSILVSFLQVLLQGSKLEDKVTENTRRAALSIAQLVQFNSIKYKRKSSVKVSRHVVEKETPLPLYIALEIYALTRKRNIIDKLAKLGICVPYNRVQLITESITSSLCKHYIDLGVVSPPGAIPEVFTTSAIDNIDQNTSSATSMNSFHGTSISLIQHPERIIEVTYGLNLETEKTLCLPESFTNIPYLPNKTSELPLATVCTLSDSLPCDPITHASEWLETVRSVTEGIINLTTVSWSAFYSNRIHECKEITPTFLLPLLNEYIATPPMIRHCMDITISSTNHINPGQVTVITGDQPVYALMKQVQWQLPRIYGEEQVVAMMGGLHIEMATLSLLGDWLEGSGWIKIMVSAGVTTSGRGDMILAGKHVKKARYAHQVSLSALYVLLKRAWATDEESYETTLTFEEWVIFNRSNSTQFDYWYTTIVLQSLMLMLVTSLRDANICMYIDALTQICPWMFALDHTHYSRWLPIFVKTLNELPTNHPSVWEEFKKGHFTSRRTKRPFSSVSDDQLHEQSNKIVKTDGDPTGLYDNPEALLKWMVSSPEVSRIILEFEMVAGISKSHGDLKHHEDTVSFEKRFVNDVKRVVDVIQTDGNPFEEKSSLTSMIDKRIISSDGEDSVRIADAIGKQQYTEYVLERLVLCKVSVHNTIKRNNLQLCRGKKTAVNKTRSKLLSSKEDSSLFSRLFIASQTREGDLTTFFAHENKKYPPSLSEFDEFRKGKKSDLVECLETHGNTLSKMPAITVTIIDGAAAVHKIKPSKQSTFEEYCDVSFKSFILSYSRESSRIDIVWDIYKEDSLKKSARLQRGTGDRIKVLAKTPIPQNWANFLKLGENKKELFNFLSRRLVATVSREQTTLVCTVGMHVISNDSIDTALIDPCTHEEADGRLLLHAKHSSLFNHRNIMISTVDSDVLIIALYAYRQLNVNELWIEFGVGRHKRYLPCHEYALSLGEAKCSAMPFWHAFSGCDTVSSFSGKGKKTVMDVWSHFEDATPVFTSLSNAPAEVSDAQLSVLERFVVVMYDRSSSIQSVNDCRKQLFTKKNRSLENVPPTQAALKEHVKRAAYQAGHVWGQCLIQAALLPEPTDWGWRNTETGYKPLWTVLPEVSAQCRELVRCGCKIQCGPKCSCVKASLLCSNLCICDGQCSRSDVVVTTE